MDSADYVAPTRDRLIEINDALRDGWNHHLYADQGEVNLPRAAEHPMTAAIVLALTSQVTETSAAAITLIRSGAAELVVMPLVRTAYETALTAHWLAQVPDATPAFINEDVRSRRSLAKDLPKARGETFRASVASVERQTIPKLTTGSAVQARNFRDMCVDLDQAGMDAYIYYRLACALVHPSVMVADQYLEKGTDEDIIVRGSSHPQGDAWLFLATASVVWAQAAANFCDKNRTRRSELRKFAKELGIPPFSPPIGCCKPASRPTLSRK
jgi:hypothetical protein